MGKILGDIAKGYIEDKDLILICSKITSMYLRENHYTHQVNEVTYHIRINTQGWTPDDVRKYGYAIHNLHFPFDKPEFRTDVEFDGSYLNIKYEVV